MPRRKIKRKTKTKTKSSHRLNLFLILVLILLLALLGTIVVGSQNGTKKVNFIKKAFFTPKLVTIAVISPYPNNYPGDNVPVQKNFGFCLYLPILTYHHIQPESQAVEKKQTSLSVDSGTFDQQMAYLIQKGYTPIFANELINALLTHSQLPGKPIMITMDDGYADNAAYALPVLQKYGIKANLMLASGLVGGNPDMLTWDQVNQMKGSGLIYFTNHTWSHYSIGNGPQSKIESEIDVAQGQIQRYTGQTVNVFTYPYGSFSNNAIQTLQRKGYIGAFSTIPGQYQCDSFIMTLHRSRIGNGSLASYGI